MKIKVIKPFVFSSLPNGDEGKLAVQVPFAVGEYEISDDMANHPWIRVHLADGCIEDPKVTLRNAEESAKQAEAALAQARKITEQAAAAFARATAGSKGAATSAADIQKELNTPASQLKTKTK